MSNPSNLSISSSVQECKGLGECHSSALQLFQETHPISRAPLISSQIVQLYLEEKLNIRCIVASTSESSPLLIHLQGIEHNRSGPTDKGNKALTYVSLCNFFLVTL